MATNRPQTSDHAPKNATKAEKAANEAAKDAVKDLGFDPTAVIKISRVKAGDVRLLVAEDEDENLKVYIRGVLEPSEVKHLEKLRKNFVNAMNDQDDPEADPAAYIEEIESIGAFIFDEATDKAIKPYGVGPYMAFAVRGMMLALGDTESLGK